ncbi:unnamed protein product [Symbiodinium sp. CCMP2592]|nr:unnamed protein product [Symbiodinium sp. CCMP2592]
MVFQRLMASRILPKARRFISERHGRARSGGAELSEGVHASELLDLHGSAIYATAGPRRTSRICSSCWTPSMVRSPGIQGRARVDLVCRGLDHRRRHHAGLRRSIHLFPRVKW